MSHTKETRYNDAKLKLPSVKLEVAKQSLYFGGAKSVYALTLELRSISDFDQFQSKTSLHHEANLVL